MTLRARELLEVVGARGDARADGGRSPVRDGANDRYRFRDSLCSSAGGDSADDEQSPCNTGAESCDRA